MNQQNALSGEALILLDFQHDFLDSKGRLHIALDQVDSVINETRELIVAAQRKDDLVIMIGNEFRRRQFVSNFFRHNAAIEGSMGAIWDERILVPGAQYIAKRESNAFSNPALKSLLQNYGIETLIVAGVFAKGCISATASAAIHQGYTVKIFTPAVGCKTDKSRNEALQRLRNQNVTLIQKL